MHEHLDELRLIALLLTLGGLFAGGVKVSRRFFSADAIASSSDGILTLLLAIYVVVGITGLAGLLTPVCLLAGSIAAFAALAWWGSGGRRLRRLNDPAPAYPHDRFFCAAGALVVVYLVAIVRMNALAPQEANDPLTYHLPAAVDWLQHRRITLFETWLYNPANTYSPLAGSMFLAWPLALVGNDTLAGLIQLPALALLFFSLLEILEAIGIDRVAGLLLACAAVLSRPVISQTALAKDDLYVAAFFFSMLASLARERFQAARAGICLGLLLATKYTALWSLPLLLPALPQFKTGGLRSIHWKQRATVVLASIALLAGPWYVRNFWLIGNPLYPLRWLGLPGLFSLAPSRHLHTWKGLRFALAGGYYSVPPPLWLALSAGWIAALVRHGRFDSPLRRVAVIGPPIGLTLFFLVSPYDELRLVLPAVVLLFVAAGFAVRGKALRPYAGLCLSLACATNFIPAVQRELVPRMIGPLLIALIIVAAWPVLLRFCKIALVSAAVVVLGWIYTQWSGHVAASRALAIDFWRGNAAYGELPDAWAFVRENLPPGETLAYANTYLIYPLYGFDLQRPLVYAPLRHDLNHVSDLPRLPIRLSGEQIQPFVAAETAESPNAEAWLDQLINRGASYVFVAKADLTGAHPGELPAEIQFADGDLLHFQRLFDNSAASIYKIHLDLNERGAAGLASNENP